jgi:hypothetical protein
MASHIERREFLATLGGAAAWSLAARAQQPAMPVVGFLYGGPLTDLPHNRVSAFRQGYAEICKAYRRRAIDQSSRRSRPQAPYRDEHDYDLVQRMLASIARGQGPQGVKAKDVHRGGWPLHASHDRFQS